MNHGQPALLIRADASVAIGSGHIMRCLALAQAWNATGGACTFLTSDLSAALRNRLLAEGMQVVSLTGAPGSPDDVEEVGRQAVALNADWIVIDGYSFASHYQRAVKCIGPAVILIDDYAHAECYTADTLFNQNLNASPDLYRGKSSARCFLLGARYALLRKEFWPWRSWTRTFQSGLSRVLVTMGGSDPDNVTSRVIHALRALPASQQSDIKVTVVVGSNNPHLSAVQATIDRTPVRTTLLANAPNMPDLMAQADIAICAGGSTCWEMAFMGLPGLALVLAENQEGSAAAFADAGLGVNFGGSDGVCEEEFAYTLSDLLANRQRLQEMSVRGRLLVDGYGALRTVEALQDSCQTVCSLL